MVRIFNISTEIYVDEYNPWTGILSAAAFAILSTTDRQKGYSPGQLIFGGNRILPINKPWIKELIRQKNQA